MNSDVLFIDRLEVACRIGTTDEERAFPQVIWISLRLTLNLRNAGVTDNFSETLDYTELVEDVRQLLHKRPFNLVEAAAESVAQTALKRKRVKAVWVRVEKKVFEAMEKIGTEIWRTRTKR